MTADPGTARSWALVPLRLFLGITFTFAGLQKLADPSYLDGSSPLSVQATIHALQHQSPIGFLLAASGHAPRLVGVLIALGELAHEALLLRLRRRLHGRVVRAVAAGRLGRADARRLDPSPSCTTSTSTTTSRAAQPQGRVIATAADVSPGSAVQFRDDGGQPAWLVHESSGAFRAFRAVCTHAGCTVQFSAASGFVCPCHGGRYDAATGAVVGGPPPSPLPRLSVQESGGKVRLA